MNNILMPHQQQAVDELVDLLHTHGIAMCGAAMRTGKSYIAGAVAERLNVKNVAVITKKNAIPGIKKAFTELGVSFDYTVINLESAHKLEGPFDFVIRDESHHGAGVGKPSNATKNLRARFYNLPLLTMTGTPITETPLAIYYQWATSKYSPFDKYRSFYKFFREYGIPDPIWVKGRAIEQYKKNKPELLDIINKYTVWISQDDAGMKHQAQDRVHTVKLDASTHSMLDSIADEGVMGSMYFDSDIACRMAQHQVEAGAVLYDDELIELPNTEVVDYLMATFGDTDMVAYFTHFRSTRKKLQSYFKHAHILSALSNAEGTDYSHLRDLVIVNQGYSGIKHTQMRDRGTNFNRTTPAIIHHIVTDGGVSKVAYDMVSKKKDFTLAAYRQHRARSRTKTTDQNSPQAERTRHLRR